MPNRPRSHELEEYSRNRLHDVFTQVGWVVWDLHPDYGEDLLVRAFVNNTATHYSFFVQAKATDHIERYMHKDGKSLSFPIKVDHIEYWGQFWEPVILTVWDAKSDVTYWEIIQDYLRVQSLVEFSNRTNIRVQIPTTNILDELGLKNIFARTRQRFERFELISDVVQALKNLLKEYSNIEVTYEPGDDHLFVRKSSSVGELTFFGEFAEQIQAIATYKKVTPQQLLDETFKDFIEEYYERASGETMIEWLINKGIFNLEYTETGRVIIYTKDGSISRIFETINEWNSVKQKKLM
jgi:hypothetical protein